MGQGEAAEQEPERSDAQAFWGGSSIPEPAAAPTDAEGGSAGEAAEAERRDNGVVVVDFRGLGPEAA
jgi:hypothetical protein